MLKKKQSRREQRESCVECNFRYRDQGRLSQDDTGVKTAGLRGSHVGAISGARECSRQRTRNGKEWAWVSQDQEGGQCVWNRVRGESSGDEVRDKRMVPGGMRPRSL